jgi:hypothetical protein
MVQFSSNDDSAESLAKPRPPNRDQRTGAGTDKPRIFTPETANRVLPLVARVAQDLVELSQELDREAAQIRGITNLRHLSDIRSFSEELDCVKESFRLDSERLGVLQRELGDLGVAIGSLGAGTIDFPAYYNTRPIRLCWKVGETSVTHWHGINEPCTERRRIEDVQGGS